jgi:hypothetical protein
VRRLITLSITASLLSVLVLCSSSAATTVTSSHPGSTFRSHSSSCAGEIYPTYIYNVAGYQTTEGSKPFALDIIKMPSYAPVGNVVAQWPEGCATAFGKGATIYLFVSSGPLNGVREVLPLAKGAPVRPECLKAVRPTADGNDYPLTCAHDEVNVAAWESYAELLPRLFALGREASRCQIYEALVKPALTRESFFTTPEVESSYTLASNYYGWTQDVAYGRGKPTTWESHCG